MSPSDVMMSARGLIQLFRSLNPQMLHKKDRVSSAELSPDGLLYF